MPIKKHLYKDPAEDEYIFECLQNYPEWAKKKLSPEEIKIFKSDVSMRMFANQAALERRDLLLAKGGFYSVKLYWNSNTSEPETIFDFDKLKKQVKLIKNRQEMIELIKSKNGFATSTREIMNMAYLIAQNTHSPYYYINRDYQKIFDAVTTVKISNLKNFDDASQTTKIKDAIKARKILGALMITLLNSENYIKVTLKVDMLDIQILLYLFLNSENFVEKKVLLKRIPYAPGSVSQRIYQLEKEGYVAKTMGLGTHKQQNPMFTIAERGIQTMGEMLEHFSNQAVNF